MKRNLLHTPDGVRDIYNDECLRKEVLTSKVRNVIKLYGYQDIQTPTFEFFDIFDKEKGSARTNELFKFFDRDGNILVLRPDMTPSIARCAVKYFAEDDMPLRLSYMGNTFINNVNYQGRLKEITQLGAELIGDDSISADAEIIAMVINVLLEAGLTEFQVEIGQVEFFKGLIKDAGLDEEVTETLRNLIQEKNYFGVEELLNSENCSDDIKNVFLRLPQLFGSYEILDEAKVLAKNDQSVQAVDRLIELSSILKTYGLLDYVSFDLGMLSRYEYYTGIIFNAYTYGTGESVAKGGRYDKLLSQFGSDIPSVGFAISADQLLSAVSRQKIVIPVGDKGDAFIYNKQYENIAIQAACEFRKSGHIIHLMSITEKCSLDYYKKYCLDNCIYGIFYLENETDVTVYDLKNNKTSDTTISELLEVK